MHSLFHNLISMSVMLFKRLWNNLGVSISGLIGIVSVLSIVVCVPVFSHAVSSEILKQQLNAKVENTHRRMFSLHSYFLDTSPKALLSINQSDTVTNFINQRLPELTSMQVEQIIVEIQSGAMPMMAPLGKGYDSPEVALKTVRFITQETLPLYSQIIEGEWPTAETTGSEPVKIAVSEQLSDEVFLNLGDVYRVGDVDVQVAGIWRANNPEDPIWFENPEAAYGDKLWVPKAVYQDYLEGSLEKPIFYISWYVIVNDYSVSFQRAPQAARGLIRLDIEMRKLLPGLSTDYSPIDALSAYQARAESLTTLFYAVGGPMIVLALLFIGLSARIAVQQYEQETATMRGRGTSWLQLAGMNLAESILLTIIALPLSVLGGWLAARVMGNTVSFLKFTSRPDLVFSLGGINLVWLGIAVLLIILSRFLPMLEVSRTTIVRMKQEQSRVTKKPVWERFYLDFFLLIPGIYAFLVMRGWAKPAKFLARVQGTGEQYRDPLLFVAPALFAIAVSMIVLRLVPVFVKLLANIVERFPGAWAYLSFQQIARRPQDHTSALLLIMISLSLSIFSASSAKTLDKWLLDSVYYSTGSDLAVHESVMQGGTPTAYGSSGTSGGSAVTLSDLDINTEGYVSIEDHLKLPSVLKATRVGKYRCTYSYGVGEAGCLVMGVDRLDFPAVGYFRDDFAFTSLGGLMNAIAIEPYSVIVPSALAAEKGFTIGDHLNVATAVLDQRYIQDMVIVGTYEYFPTVYPDQLPTLIANLDSIFGNPDDVIGYDIWLKLRGNTDVTVLLHQLRQLIGSEKAIVDVRGNAFKAVKTSQDQPERMGLFGILNVGFLATGLMPGIGFVLYSYASLRRRFIQLGILQAIGLSVRQLIGYLVSEQLLLMGIAILSGALIGLLSSFLFIPFLQVGAAPGAPVPPFQVLVGWTESAWLSLAFGVVLFLTIVGTIAYLIQLQVFQAVKLGEAM